MVYFKTLDDFNVKSKTVIVRVDFNSEINSRTKQVTNGIRICAHAQFTLKELAEKGAKTVILSHQGRKNDPDYTDLRQHADILRQILKKHPVKYVDDLFGEKAQNEIKQLQDGEILVLENVRGWSEETKRGTPEQQSKSALVQNLAPLADLFVNDAFSVAHRDNVSVVGFTTVLPSVAGRIMERELKQLKALENHHHPCVYVLGGAKADDSLEISKYILNNNVADNLLLGGIISQLFMTAKGIPLGKGTMDFLAKKELLNLIPGIQELLATHPDKIMLPVDVALNVDGKRTEVPINQLPSEHPIFDIGTKTVENYVSILSKAQVIVVSGPLGVYENKDFCYGSKTIFETIANSNVLSLAGGGNTIAAIDQFGLTNKIRYISTAGGALVEALMGKKLPGVIALETASQTKNLNNTSK